ncbi:MAG TPA: DUF1674 domain-containing protein [Stellaceae bacterium]|nr:DUF1674 domain-containing protein [Stellaceae bacterium]
MARKDTRTPTAKTGEGAALEAKPAPGTTKPREIGGPKGPEPTRYGDWEVNGRCSDF